MALRILVFVGFALVVALFVMFGRPYLFVGDAEIDNGGRAGMATRRGLDSTAPAAVRQAHREVGTEGGASPQPSEMQPAEMQPGERARALVAQVRQATEGADLDALFDRAIDFRQAGDLVDAHILLFFSAREGHPASARELATLYDPLGFSKQRSIMDEPVPAQAYKWYRRAAEAGDAEARERLMQLRQWAEGAAAGGDAEAQQLLLQWH